MTPPSRAASIWQTEIGLGLEELLEHDPVVDVLAGRHPDRRDAAGDRRVAEDVVGRGRLLDPVRIELGQSRHPGDRFVDAPALVRVDGQHRVGADLLAHDPGAPAIVLDVRADLQLEPRPALRQRLAAQPADLVVVVAQPADRCRVGRVPVAPELCLAIAAGRCQRLEPGEGPLRRSGRPRCTGSRRARRAPRASCRRAASRAACRRSSRTGPRRR